MTGTIASRIKKLRSKMQDDDYFLLSSVSSLRYFTGFNAHPDVGFALIPSTGKSIVVTDGRYETQIEQEIDSELFEILIEKTGKEYLDKLKEKFSPSNSFRLHVEEQGLSMLQYLKIKEFWPKAEIISSSNKVRNIRFVKEPEEIVLIKKAIKITEYALQETLPLIKVGMPENDVAAEITYRQNKLGASNDAFPLIVASGQNSALPHGGDRRGIIKSGDLLQFDIGCVYEGYHSDISRVAVVGARPDGKQFEIYQIVRRIQEECIAEIKPGINLKCLFQYYCASLKRAGFEIQHALGHGIGLEIHELPNLSSENFTAKPGQVFTIEPGIYIPGEFGVRIEDDVLVTEIGYEVLTGFSKDLEILDF